MVRLLLIMMILNFIVVIKGLLWCGHWKTKIMYICWIKKIVAKLLTLSSLGILHKEKKFELNKRRPKLAKSSGIHYEKWNIICLTLNILTIVLIGMCVLWGVLQCKCLHTFVHALRMCALQDVF